MPNPLDSLLTAAGIRRVIQQIPTELVALDGGLWDSRIASVNADDDELTMFDANVPVSADLLAPSATSRDVTEGPNITRLDRAFRLKQSSKLTHTDLKYLLKMADLYGRAGRLDAGASGSLSNWLTRKKADRLRGVAILRGRLKYGLAQGEFSYNQGGYQYTSDFGMDASMKASPTTKWLNNAGQVNVLATPVTDLGIMQTTAYNLEGRRFDTFDIPRATYNAMVQTNEFKEIAKSVQGYNLISSLPSNNDERLIAIAGEVLQVAGRPIKINIDDQEYRVENTDGTRTTGRYLNLNYGVLSNSADYGRPELAYDWANVPVTETIVADAIGDGAVFGGQNRGPIGYFTGDKAEYNWMRSHATQEGVPRRWLRTATARLTLRGDN